MIHSILPQSVPSTRHSAAAFHSHKRSSVATHVCSQDSIHQLIQRGVWLCSDAFCDWAPLSSSARLLTTSSATQPDVSLQEETRVPLSVRVRDRETEATQEERSPCRLYSLYLCTKWDTFREFYITPRLDSIAKHSFDDPTLVILTHNLQPETLGNDNV